ncbi:MAG TPA: hypothetical protein VGC07_06650 [Granulicella sp.]
MTNQFAALLERLSAAAEALEQAAVRLSASGSDVTIVAEAEPQAELAARLAAAEERIAELAASATTKVTNTAGRKTLPLAMSNLLAKQGVAIESLEAGALDAAMTSLSLEQRIAVKAQLMRAGLLG